jgi:hypothetical protein
MSEARIGDPVVSATRRRFATRKTADAAMRRADFGMGSAAQSVLKIDRSGPPDMCNCF